MQELDVAGPVRAGAGSGAGVEDGVGTLEARRRRHSGGRRKHFFIDSDRDMNHDGDEDNGGSCSNSSSIGSISSSDGDDDDDDDSREAQQHLQQHHLVHRHSNPDESPGIASSTNSMSSKPFADRDQQWQRQRRRHCRRRSSWALDEGQCPWSPWSRWRLVLKLLYAVLIPTAIIYVLQQANQTLQSQDNGLSSRATKNGGAGSGGGARRDSVQRKQDHPWQHRVHQGWKESSSPWKETLWGLALRNRQLGHHHHNHHRLGHWPGAEERQQQSSPPQQPLQHQQLQGQPFDWTMIQQTFFDSFVLFGDSITQYSFDVNEQGFGAQLAHLFQRRLDLINRGFSGYTSEQAIYLLPQFLPRAQPPMHPEQHQDSQSSPPSLVPPPKIQFLTIFFGANDACLSPSPQHVELDRYEHNMRTLINMVHDPSSPTYSPETRIIIICPPPIDEARWAIRRKERGMAMDRDKEVTRRYAQTCLRIGQEYAARNEQQQPAQQRQVEVIDTWGIMTRNVESGEMSLDDYLKDGLHLASVGNNVIFEEIMKVIRGRYPEWDPETMPMHAPWWGNLDPQHPETDLLICGNKPKPSST